MLLRELCRGDEYIGVALELLAAKPDQDFMVLVKNQAVLRTVDAKLVDRRPQLGRKSEVSRCSLFLADDDSQFIHDLAFVYLLQDRADKPVRDHVRRIGS